MDNVSYPPLSFSTQNGIATLKYAPFVAPTTEQLSFSAELEVQPGDSAPGTLTLGVGGSLFQIQPGPNAVSGNGNEVIVYAEYATGVVARLTFDPVPGSSLSYQAGLVNQGGGASAYVVLWSNPDASLPATVTITTDFEFTGSVGGHFETDFGQGGSLTQGSSTTTFPNVQWVGLHLMTGSAGDTNESSLDYSIA